MLKIDIIFNIIYNTNKNNVRRYEMINKISKKSISKKVADLALGITKANVNSFCVYFGGQEELPKGAEKLKNNSSK